MMGTVIGGTAMAGSLGMSTGPLLGGLIYDHFGSYALMYVGSWGMGADGHADPDELSAVPRGGRPWRRLKLGAVLPVHPVGILRSC